MVNDTCDLSLTVQQAIDQMAFAAYRVLTPIYFILGVFGRSIFILTFLKQYKKEKAYAYQIFAAISDFFEVISVFLCMLTRNYLSGYRLPGALWYEQNYPLMWFAAHLASPIELACITTSLLIYVSMAIDRVFAIANPFKYKSINHIHHQSIAVAFCALFGFSLSIFDVFRDDAQKSGDIYVISSNKEYTKTTIAIVLAWFRTAVFIGGDLVLTVSNVVMVAYYHSSVSKQAAKKFEKDSTTSKRKSTQKTLVLLTVCQSTFTTINMTVNSVYYSFVYSGSAYLSCISKILSPVANLVILSAGILQLITLFVVYKHFRHRLLNFLRCKKTPEPTQLAIWQPSQGGRLFLRSAGRTRNA